MTDHKIHLSAGKEDTRPRTPSESAFFAYAGIAPVACGAVAFFLLQGNAAAVAVRLTVVWAGAILCFLAGVRRGLSFRQEGGPLLTQLATMLSLFALGFASLVVPWIFVSLSLQIVGFAILAVYDPFAARRGEVPRYFERLRPVQMMIPLVSLAAIVVGLAA